MADFGALSILGFDTFTTAIYKSWLSLFSLDTAAQLASLLLMFALVVMIVERASRHRGDQQVATRDSIAQERIELQGASKWIAQFYCSLVVALALLLPVSQLLIWVFDDPSTLFRLDLLQLSFRTFALAFAAACLVLFFCLFLMRPPPRSLASWQEEWMSAGYALPGSVLAIGIMAMLAGWDAGVSWLTTLMDVSNSPVLLGSLVGLLLAYLIRFMRPAMSGVRTGLIAVHPHQEETH